MNKSINSSQGLNSIMSVLAKEDKLNSYLVAALKASATLTSNNAAAATVGSVVAAIPAMNLKL